MTTGALHPDVFIDVNNRLDSMRNDMLRLNPFPLDVDGVYRAICTDGAYEAYLHAKPYFQTLFSRWDSTHLSFRLTDYIVKVSITGEGNLRSKAPGERAPIRPPTAFPVGRERAQRAASARPRPGGD